MSINALGIERLKVCGACPERPTCILHRQKPCYVRSYASRPGAVCLGTPPRWSCQTWPAPPSDRVQ
jgi:hypothetical protein